ncbi:arginine--tRNA ligase [bacterium]|nr:arginine--tRNA ligase [bacterium]
MEFEEIKRLKRTVRKAIGGEKGTAVFFEHPTLPEHGDYSTNIALILAKKRKTSPRQLAEEIVENLKKEKEKIWEKVEVAGPGFINFWFTKEYLLERAKFINHRQKLKETLQKKGKGKTVVIDYSSPNIAKPFGIGHLRSTNIGQAIYNLYRTLGWKTVGDNHLGDWGTQFGKLIVAIKKWGKKDLSALTIKDLEELYVRFHQEASRNPSLEEEGREWFKKLEEKDPEAVRIWRACVDISWREFARIYRLLGVKIDFAYGESFYQDKMEEVVKEAEEKEIAKKSKGALIVEIPGLSAPAMLKKSDGATTYLLRDLAAIKFRLKKWQPDLIIYEVGADQSLHFKQLFAVAEMLGWTKKVRLIHVAHGMIRWEKGKFSTRKGETIHLEEVIQEGIKRAKKLIASSQTGKNLSQKEREKVAQAVAIGGIKFNDLKQEPQKDIIFSWEKVLSFEGYSAPYLQYTLARCFSILKKKSFSGEVSLPEKINKEEESLLRTFYRFPEVIAMAAENFSPHFLAQYLFELAQKFNLFYQKHKVLGSNRENFRLFLVLTVKNILQQGLEILGIEVLERM